VGWFGKVLGGVFGYGVLKNVSEKVKIENYFNRGYICKNVGWKVYKRKFI
jgi:hypothetical protein